MRGINQGSDELRAGLLAGLFGGISFAIFAIAATGYLGLGHAFALNQIAAVIPEWRPPAHGFVAVSLAGLAIDLVVGCLWGVIYGVTVGQVLPRLARSFWGATLFGVGLGGLAWALSGILIGLTIDPSLRLTNPLDYYFAHFIYGMITAWSFAALSRRRRLAITIVPAETVRRTTSGRM